MSGEAAFANSVVLQIGSCGERHPACVGTEVVVVAFATEVRILALACRRQAERR